MFQKLFRSFVYGNFWVGLSVACLAGLSMLRYDYWNAPYFYLCFFSTVAFYGYARWVETSDSISIPEQNIAAWTIRNRDFVLVISLLASLGAVFSWFSLPLNAQWIFAGASALSGFYSIPTVFNRKGVRYLAGFKLIYIALIWVIVTETIPTVLSGGSTPLFTLLHHLERFAFIIAITIPFDIRDAQTDSTDLITLPMWLGEKKARNIAILAIAIVILLQFIPGFFNHQLWWNIGVYTLGGILIYRSGRDLPDMYFSFWLEGLPVLLALQYFYWMFIANF